MARALGRTSSGKERNVGYVERKSYPIPKDPSAAIWRYMSFTKFVALIARSELWFSRADLLGDAFEGSMSRANLAVQEVRPSTGMSEARIRHNLLEWTFINCWTSVPHESVALWRAFADSDGICIRSSFQSLVGSLGASDDDVVPSLVRYIDYEAARVPVRDLLAPFRHKRHAFEYEAELRLLIQRWPLGPAEGKSGSQYHIVEWERDAPPGLAVPVDLDVLIHEVRVAPTLSLRLRPLAEEVLAKWGLRKPVLQSELEGVPVY